MKHQQFNNRVARVSVQTAKVMLAYMYTHSHSPPHTANVAYLFFFSFCTSDRSPNLDVPGSLAHRRLIDCRFPPKFVLFIF